MDIDSFELDDDFEQELEKKHQAFIDNQEEIEASNECEGGACVI